MIMRNGLDTWLFFQKQCSSAAVYCSAVNPVINDFVFYALSPFIFRACMSLFALVMVFPFFRDPPETSDQWDHQEHPDCPVPRLPQVDCLHVLLSASKHASRLVNHTAARAERRDLTSCNKISNINYHSTFFILLFQTVILTRIVSLSELN